MPRQGRIHLPGGIYHVIVRGIERRKIFRTPADRAEFIRRLAKGLEATKIQCYAWCLMSNHLHLLLSPTEKPLTALMHGLLTGYVMYFNRRHKRVGRLLQNRYKSILCEKDAYFLELIRYIHLNPLRAGVVRSLHELAVYPWAGHSTLLGNRKRKWQTTQEVLIWFGKRKSEALRRYIEFVRDGEAEGENDILEGGGLCRSAGGWEGVKALKQWRETWQGDERILGEGEFVEDTLKQSEEQMLARERAHRNGWDIDRLTREICGHLGVNPCQIKRKCRLQAYSIARSLIAYCAYQEMGLRRLEIARFLGISGPGVSKMVRRGYRERGKIELSY